MAAVDLISMKNLKIDLLWTHPTEFFFKSKIKILINSLHWRRNECERLDEEENEKAAVIRLINFQT
jgi:hypothetical protein